MALWGVRVGSELDCVGASEFLIWGTCSVNWRWDTYFISIFTSSSEILGRYLHICYFLHCPQKVNTALYLSSQNFPLVSLSQALTTANSSPPTPVSPNVVELYAILSMISFICEHLDEKWEKRVFLNQQQGLVLWFDVRNFSNLFTTRISRCITISKPKR